MRDSLDIGPHEADLLQRRLNDLTMLTPYLFSPLSSPAIARALCDAIEADGVEEALALIALGANPNVLHPVRETTALSVAAEKGDLETIKCGEVHLVFC